MPHNEGFSDREVATLRRLRAEGKTGAEIADRLCCSRGKVFGKLHRLGLTAPRRAKKQAAGAAPQNRPRVPKQAEASPPVAPKPQTIEPPAQPAAPIPAVVVVERAKPAVDPSPTPQRPIAGGCCWPLWDDATPRSQRRQCGAPRDDVKSPYCTDHRKRAVDRRGWQEPRVVQMIQPCR